MEKERRRRTRPHIATLLGPTQLLPPKKTRGVSHCGLAIFTLKKKYIFLKAKEEELWKLKYFTMQKYNLQKKIL
jgi:hypothetical protein